MNMKRSYLKNIALALSVVFTVQSCNWVDPDINVDPDSPTDVPMSLILPNVQANLAYDIGGNDIVRPLNIWMQYFNGHSRQSNAQARYIYTPSDVNNLWNSFYYGSLMDLRKIEEKAEQTNSNHYLGVTYVLQALSLMTLTDLYGDIPWSEALNEGANLNPKPDPQQEIYANVIAMLDRAIELLGKPNEGEPLKGDLIFDNDEKKWKDAAYALKARAQLVQSKKNPNAYADVRATLIEGGLSEGDNMTFAFSEAGGCAHPIYQFLDQRGDINMGKTFVDYLISTNDPRLAFYSNGAVGGVIGSEEQDGIATVGPYIGSNDSKVWFITYAEQKFMEAEALLPTNPGAAHEAYLKAIEASLVQVGVPNADDDKWKTNYPAFYDAVRFTDPNNLTLEAIINQKYVALFGTMYCYNDWRRTGYPNFLVVPQNAVQNEIPRRYPYSQSEIVYNENINPVSINERVWWDE
ncbi:MAG TPA: SusD/RagB family nutrient-binding outer membrane lipoprotein [Bacteroidales bacterium]|nr:SusD/RagB family nutrient-binding outer membrane lipoprotein [Bacteroidales bacterium]